ncbi:hypothetical protein GOHSU_07_00060 [Gordonia hirsuta DSM 44140 = NBRC 16056]|uniref:Polyketide cyclase/dehydrase n=1 Tax=Gordonia hirsuta DSM 44140 = NBRC 16056 TaxID=1121927 RepID=L7L8S9_9ACTN|nr:SRPBCC family protein [Gordonia hirsuta]GAC56452.1 hypothetical protein GOHSU_07_00060 [Gordonia hirsuta DSM 44140 = NBRC 16056]
MAKTSAWIDTALAPQEAFAALTDLSRFGDWLVFHDSWQDTVPKPADVAEGRTIASVINVKGTAIPLRWTVQTYRAPQAFRFAAKEKGVKVAIGFTVEPAGPGARIGFELGLSGLPVVGPIGKKVVQELHDDVVASLDRFAVLLGS